MDSIPPPSETPDDWNDSTETYHRSRKPIGPRLRRAATALAVGVAVAYTFVRTRPFRVEVEGPSMAPTLVVGDYALAVRPRRLRRGDVVVIEHPDRPGFEMVKRITGAEGDLTPDGRILGRDEWWVVGDNLAESTDSRHFGPVRTGLVRAKVLLVWWPPARRHLL